MIASRYIPVDANISGGMGEVIICRDNHLERQVVIKRLRPGEDARRIADEHQALSKLRSKHVVQLYDLVELNDRGFPETGIVLEFISGADLTVGSCTVGLSYLKLIWQIACGIKDIHVSNVVHRDIKPSNIRVDAEGIAKILDFGLARLDEDARTKSLIGTPGFMAPELWTDGQIKFTKAVDVYAFGVLCLALVNSRPPRALTLRPPAHPSRIDVDAILSGLPHDLIEIIYQCLADNPAERPAMNTIQKVIEKHLLKDRHRALVVMGGAEHWLHKDNRRIVFSAGTVGRVGIEYDGFQFKIVLAEGDVSMNNVSMRVGQKVPGCCVIGIGRKFVTFDESNPEVIA